VRLGLTATLNVDFSVDIELCLFRAGSDKGGASMTSMLLSFDQFFSADFVRKDSTQ